MSSSYKTDAAADGKRRVLRDDLGTLRPVAGGDRGAWELTIPGYGTHVFPEREAAINEARAFLGDYD